MSHGFLIAVVTAACVVAFAPQAMAQFGGIGGPGIGAPPGGGGTARTTTVKSSKSNTSDRIGTGGGGGVKPGKKINLNSSRSNTRN